VAGKKEEKIGGKTTEVVGETGASKGTGRVEKTRDARGVGG